HQQAAVPRRFPRGWSCPSHSGRSDPGFHLAEYQTKHQRARAARHTTWLCRQLLAALRPSRVSTGFAFLPLTDWCPLLRGSRRLLHCSYLSPSHQEFGLAIGSLVFKARSPFTHLISVHIIQQIKTTMPIPNWIVRSPTRKNNNPIQNVVI